MDLILRIVKVKRKKVMSGTAGDQAIEHLTKDTIIDLWHGQADTECSIGQDLKILLLVPDLLYDLEQVLSFFAFSPLEQGASYVTTMFVSSSDILKVRYRT